MASSSGDQYIFNEQVTFVQYHLPGLEAGAYQLSVSQQVEKKAAGDKPPVPLNDETLANTYTFAVKGDRFRLQNPADIVFGVFPEENGSGQYSTVLPHVVFTKKTFPWTRLPTPTMPPDPSKGVPTWLAVLLLDEDDAAAHQGLNLTPQPAVIGDLFPAAAYADSTLGSNVSYFAGATDTTDLDLGDVVTDQIQVLDLPLPLFWQLAPTVVDLNYTAHARQVSLLPKATLPGISDVGEPLGDFAIVVGNRLPQRQKKSVAYLVSLEGLSSLLPNDNGTAPTGLPADDPRSIRLAVLHSWPFFTTGAAADFDQRVLALNGRQPDSQGPPTLNTTLRLPYPNATTVVGRALDMGYVPLNQVLRTGESTVSWYRGPLLPYALPGPRLTVPVASPDQATVFDPTTGMLDASYAAAWTLGRLLSLQDKSFSTSLYTWKQGLSAQVVQAVGAEMLQEQLGLLLPPETPDRALLRAPAPAADPTEATVPAAPTLRRALLQVLLQSH